jgi:predicted nucleic acid-binding protein
MEKAIFDTSVWIDLFNNVTSPQTSYLLDCISSNSDLVFLTPTIIQEILQGVKSERNFKEKESVLLSFNCVEQDWKTASLGAAKLYFGLRKKGITIRKSADCLIAQAAIANNYLLVHNDSDFDLIAKGSDLRVF